MREIILSGNNGGVVDEQACDSSDWIKLLGRTWLLQANGATSPGIVTNLVFDVSSFNLDSARVKLIIDHTANTNINLSNADFIIPDSISENKAYFSGVHWDVDGNHKEMFSLLFDRTPLSMTYHPSTSTTTNASSGNTYNDPPDPNFPQNNNTQVLEINSLLSGTQSTSIFISALPIINEDGDRFQVYPNPSPGHFTLSIDLQEQSTIKVIITDLQGQVIQQYEMSGQRTYLIQGEIITSGTFFLDIAYRDQHKYLKLIVR